MEKILSRERREKKLADLSYSLKKITKEDEWEIIFLKYELNLPNKLTKHYI